MSNSSSEKEVESGLAGSSAEEQKPTEEITGQGQILRRIEDVMGQCNGISEAITILTENFKVIRRKVTRLCRLNRKAFTWQRRWPAGLTYNRYRHLLYRKRKSHKKKSVLADKKTGTTSSNEGASPSQENGKAGEEMYSEGYHYPSDPASSAPRTLPKYQSYYGAVVTTRENFYDATLLEEGGMNNPAEQACFSPKLDKEREYSPTSPSNRGNFSPTSPKKGGNYSFMTPPKTISYSPTSPVCRPHYSPASSLYRATSSNTGSSSQGALSYHGCFSPATPEYSDVLRDSIYNRVMRSSSSSVQFYTEEGDGQSPRPYGTLQKFPAVGERLGEECQVYMPEDPMEGPSSRASLHSQMKPPSPVTETTTDATTTLVDEQNGAADEPQVTQPETTTHLTLLEDHLSLDDDNDGDDENNEDNNDDVEYEDDDTDSSINSTLGPKLSSLPENFPHDPVLWTVDDVILFLNRSRSPTLMFLASLCEKHEIDGRALLMLESDVLIRHMGVKVGVALKLSHYIQCLRDKDLEDE